MAAFFLYAVLSLAGMVVHLDRVALLRDLEREAASLERADFSDRLASVIGIAQPFALLIAGVVFIWFFHRAYKNVRAFGRNTSHGTGWAIGGWFVPLLSLFRPKQIASEIWTKSGTDPHGDAPKLLSWWWAVFLVGILASQAAGAAVSPADGDIADLRTESIAAVVAHALDFVGLLLVITVTRGIAARQEVYAATLRRETIPPAPHVPSSIVALIPLIAGLLVAAPVAAQSQRLDESNPPLSATPPEVGGAVEPAGGLATAEALPTEAEVASMDAACQQFNQRMEGLPEPESFDALAAYFEEVIAAVDQRDAALTAASPTEAAAAAAYTSTFLEPVRADSDRARAAFRPVIEAARAGDSARVDQHIAAIPDELGAVPDAAAYAQHVGAGACQLAFEAAPAEAP